MIQKTTKIICDNCGKGIYDWPENLSYREIVDTCKEKDIAIVRYIIGKITPLIFCDEECLKEWEKENIVKKHKYE